MIGHNEAEPLGLSRRQLNDLEAFLLSLAAAPATPPELLGPPDETHTRLSGEPTRRPDGARMKP